LEVLLRQTRAQLLEGFEQAVMRQVDPVLERTKTMLLSSTEEIIRQHAAPLVGQLRSALQECLEEVVKHQMAPLMERAQQGMQETLHFAPQFADVVVGRLKVTVAEPSMQMMREEMPRHAQWLGRRLLDCVLAATLFCLAAVFLLVGGVLGLEETGLKPFAAYGIGGLAALIGGLVFLRLLTQQPSPADKPAKPPGG
jgi:hypothetical protein